MDLIGREDKYTKVPLDNTYPTYLIKNIDKYKNEWIV